MNQRIHNLSKWRHVPEGEGVHFFGDRPRVVILEVNCPAEVCFYIRQDRDAILNDPERISDEEAGRLRADDVGVKASDEADDPVSFIAVVKGRDRLEFAVDGAFDLIVEGGPAYIFSADGQDIATRIIAPVIFTRIANRRQRNPHLEMMEYQMRLNVQRMQEQLKQESERRIQALERKLESYAPQRDERAPPERVGKAPGRDRGSEGDAESVSSASGAASDEIAASDEVPRKRKKAAAVDDA